MEAAAAFWIGFFIFMTAAAVLATVVSVGCKEPFMCVVFGHKYLKSRGGYVYSYPKCIRCTQDQNAKNT